MAKDPAGRKVCIDCGHDKPIEQFHHLRQKNGSVYRYPYCKVCRRVRRRQKTTPPEALARKRERYANDPEYRRKVLNAQHLSRYGITLEDKEALLAAQGGVCAACGRDESKGHGWTTDHDHRCCPGNKSCGKCIRAILCTNCNLALGHVGDSIERLEALVEYLRPLAGMSPSGNPQMGASVSRMQPI